MVRDVTWSTRHKPPPPPKPRLKPLPPLPPPGKPSKAELMQEAHSMELEAQRQAAKLERCVCAPRPPLGSLVPPPPQAGALAAPASLPAERGGGCRLGRHGGNTLLEQQVSKMYVDVIQKKLAALTADDDEASA